MRRQRCLRLRRRRRGDLRLLRSRVEQRRPGDDPSVLRVDWRRPWGSVRVRAVRVRRSGPPAAGCCVVRLLQLARRRRRRLPRRVLRRAARALLRVPRRRAAPRLVHPPRRRPPRAPFPPVRHPVALRYAQRVVGARLVVQPVPLPLLRRRKRRSAPVRVRFAVRARAGGLAGGGHAAALRRGGCCLGGGDGGRGGLGGGWGVTGVAGAQLGQTRTEATACASRWVSRMALWLAPVTPQPSRPAPPASLPPAECGDPPARSIRGRNACETRSTHPALSVESDGRAQAVEATQLSCRRG